MHYSTHSISSSVCDCQGIRRHPHLRFQGFPPEARTAARYPGLRFRASFRGYAAVPRVIQSELGNEMWCYQCNRSAFLKPSLAWTCFAKPSLAWERPRYAYNPPENIMISATDVYPGTGLCADHPSAAGATGG